MRWSGAGTIVPLSFPTIEEILVTIAAFCAHEGDQSGPELVKVTSTRVSAFGCRLIL